MSPKELQDCCRALDSEWPVTLGQLKAARNLQAQAWHPDRFQHQERVRLEAEEKLKRVNVAFEGLTKLITEGRTAICGRCRTPVKELHNGLCVECVPKRQRVSRTKTSRQRRPNREERPLQYVDIRGRWQNEAGGVEFFGEGPTYRFAEWGLMGQVGDGMATVSRRVVTLRGRNVLLGIYELSLVVNDSMLMGTINLMGIPVPYQLWRA